MKFAGTSLSRLLHACLLALLLPLGLGAAPLPISALYEESSLDLAKVSLDGKQVAMRARIDGEQYLALMDTSTMQLKLAAKFTNTELREIIWKRDDFLLMTMLDDDGTGEFRSYDLKTQKIESLAQRQKFRSAVFRSTLPDDPDHLIFDIYSGAGTFLGKMNIRTGSMEVLQNSDSRVQQWFVTHQGEPLAAYCDDASTRSIRWRPAPNAPWQQKELGPTTERWQLKPFGIHPDQKRLLAWDRSGQGTFAVVALDPGTLAKELIFQHPEVDVEQVYYWMDDLTFLTCIRYENDRPRLQFLDPEIAKIQAIIDASLPETFNLVQSISRDLNTVVIQSESDRDSGMYYLLNRSARKLAAIGPIYRSRDPASMGLARAFSFQSKDGLKIHGRLLLPPGNPAKPPVMLMLRGFAGPRSRMEFNQEFQIYASRGYAVVVIDYRGVGGYGQAFDKAGDYQFATGMVDDIEAGLDYLVAQGWVDGDRIGLVTRGYGGVVGLQTMMRRDRFKVWLNIGTTLYENPLKQEYLTTSERKPAEIVSDLGGKPAVKSMLESLHPGNLLSRVTVPSFHLYEYAYLNTPFIKKNIKTPPDKLEIINVPEIRDPKAAQAAGQAAREKMMAFLAKWLPPAGPAK